MLDKNKENIAIIIALLAGVFTEEIGLDVYVSSTLSTMIIGISIGILGYKLRDKFFTQQAEVILRPKTAELLKKIDAVIEKRYPVDIPDELQDELIIFIWGDETDGY